MVWSSSGWGGGMSSSLAGHVTKSFHIQAALQGGIAPTTLAMTRTTCSASARASPSGSSGLRWARRLRMTPMGRPTVAKAHSVGVLPRAGGVETRRSVRSLSGHGWAVSACSRASRSAPVVPARWPSHGRTPMNVVSLRSAGESVGLAAASAALRRAGPVAACRQPSSMYTPIRTARCAGSVARAGASTHDSARVTRAARQRLSMRERSTSILYREWAFSARPRA